MAVARSTNLSFLLVAVTLLVLPAVGRRDRNELPKKLDERKKPTTQTQTEEKSVAEVEESAAAPRAVGKVQLLSKTTSEASRLETASEVASNVSTRAGLLRFEDFQHQQLDATMNLMQFGNDLVLKATTRSGTPPDEYLALGYALLFMIYFAKIMYMDWPLAQEMLEKRKAIAEETQDLFLGSVQELVVQLQEARETTSQLAELHFQEKYRGFTKFLNHIVRSKIGRSPGSPVTEGFKKYLKMWMAAFGEVASEPDTKPLILCEEEKMASAKNLVEFAKIIMAESKGKVKNLAEDAIKEAQDLYDQLQTQKDAEVGGGVTSSTWFKFEMNFKFSGEPQKKESPLPYDIEMFCAKLTLVSQWHAGLLGCGLFGVLLSLLMHLTSKHFYGLLVNVATVMIVVLLFLAEALDEHIRLDKETAATKQEQENVEAIKAKIYASMEKASRVTKLWRYKTMNMLDLFEAVEGLSYSLDFADPDREKQVSAIIESFAKRIEAVVDGMGELENYLADDELGGIPENILQMACKQMKANIGVISELADAGNLTKMNLYIDNIFNYLLVVIKQAKDVPNLDAGLFYEGQNKTDSFIVLRIDDKPVSDCPTTKVIMDDLNPVFDEEFFVEVPVQSNDLRMELFDSDADQWVGGDPDGIGYLKCSFREKPGQWVKRRGNFFHWENKTKMTATLEYELFFITSLKDVSVLEAQAEGGMEGAKSIATMKAAQSLGAFLAGI